MATLPFNPFRRPQGIPLAGGSQSRGINIGSPQLQGLSLGTVRPGGVPIAPARPGTPTIPMLGIGSSPSLGSPSFNTPGSPLGGATGTTLTQPGGIPINPATPQISGTPAQPGPITPPPQTDQRDTNGLLINPPGALFDRNTGRPLTPPQQAPAAQQSPATPTIAPPAPAPAPTPAPAAPAIPQVDTSDIESQIIAGLTPTEREQELINRLAQLEAAQNLGLQNIEDKVIPMEFITGQQQSLERRGLLQQQTLQQRLAIEQAKRQAGLDVSKFRLERADEQARAAREAAEEDVTPTIQEFQFAQTPAGGGFTGTFEEFKRGEKGAEGVTLSPGQVRFERDPATGELRQVATGGEKPLSPTQEAKALEQVDKELNTQQQASTSLQLINSLLTGDRYKAISGITQTGSIPFLGDRAAVNEYNQLQGLLKLGIRGLLKGQGQISDYEGKILGSAASSLSRLTNEAQFKEALQKIKGVIRTNQGQRTEVKVLNPKTGDDFTDLLSGQEIFELVSEGNKITYL